MTDETTLLNQRTADDESRSPKLDELILARQSLRSGEARLSLYIRAAEAKAFAEETAKIASKIDAAAIGLAVASRLVVVRPEYPEHEERREKSHIAMVVRQEIRKASATKAYACRGDHGAPEGSADPKSDTKSADRPGEMSEPDYGAMVVAIDLCLQERGMATLQRLVEITGCTVDTLSAYVGGAKHLMFSTSGWVVFTGPQIPQ